MQYKGISTPNTKTKPLMKTSTLKDNETNVQSCSKPDEIGDKMYT